MSVSVGTYRKILPPIQRPTKTQNIRLKQYQKMANLMAESFNRCIPIVRFFTKEDTIRSSIIEGRITGGIIEHDEYIERCLKYYEPYGECRWPLEILLSPTANWDMFYHEMAHWIFRVEEDEVEKYAEELKKMFPPRTVK